MKITVLVKYSRGEINPFDASALECALALSDEVTVLSMAPRSAEAGLSALTRLGVRAVLVCDPLYAGSDTIATAHILSSAIRRLAPDVIFAGRQSVDGDTGQVPPMLAELLGLTLVPRATEMNGTELTLRSMDRIELACGMLVTFEKIRRLRFPSIFSRAKAVEVWDNTVLALAPERCGLQGSPTRVVSSYESSVGRRECSFVAKDELDTLIREGLTRAGLSADFSECENKLPLVLALGEVESAARSIAERVVYLDHRGKDIATLAEEIELLSPDAVLFDDADEIKALGARIAAVLGVGMCADCISFTVKDGRLVMTRPALGGNITADIVSTRRPVFASVRSVRQGGSRLVFTVGMGALPYIDRLRALSDRYGAELASTRPVADSGSMPYVSQVGVTGRIIAPSVLVTFGVSGAVQHTAAISGAGTVIAVNSDRSARIFDYADFGIVTDVNDII
ncbi:MAG: FAD-binding protein [Clostridia bacterium]|nr:FAD-binding protein [Clostridia bacterium]